jgi:hypothetical protein
VRLELRVDKLGTLEAEITRVRHDELKIARGAKIGVVPRRMQTFLSGGSAGPVVGLQRPAEPEPPQPPETPKGRAWRPSSDMLRRLWRRP